MRKLIIVIAVAIIGLTATASPALALETSWCTTHTPSYEECTMCCNSTFILPVNGPIFGPITPNWRALCLNSCTTKLAQWTCYPASSPWC